MEEGRAVRKGYPSGRRGQKEMATPRRSRLVEGDSSPEELMPRARSRATSILQTDPKGLTPTTERSCASDTASLRESFERGVAVVARPWRTPRTRTARPVPVGTTSTAARADQKRPEFSTIP